MTKIQELILDVDDVAAAEPLYGALGLDSYVRLRTATAASDGFRGFTLSLVASQPATVDALVDAARAAGATVLQPPKKSLWGYGGAVRGQDGTVITFASSSKKNTAPASDRADEVVLQLGVADVAASRDFYAARGLQIAKSYGKRYVEFATPSSPVKLALLPRDALAKTAGVPSDGSGSHRLAIVSDAGSFADPDGYPWESTPDDGATR